MSDAILALNAGSSSIKFALFSVAVSLRRSDVICDGKIEGLGDCAHFIARDSANAILIDRQLPGPATHETALKILLEWFQASYSEQTLIAAGHRVVHGGKKFSAPILIDKPVMSTLRRLIPLAPLHQPHNLAAIDALSKLYPKLPQIACFDTAFHQTQSPVVTEFAIPRALTNEGIRRYGFHGLSYEYIASELPAVLGPGTAEGRVVVAHLGNGASMCAMYRQKSVATTMGFTALDGLVMGRRCGTIDPGVILYLLQSKGMSADSVGDLLYNNSGLLGVSGIGSDMRELLASDDTNAKHAIELFVYRILRELGSLTAALGGLDALVFTAGIGENAVEIRRQVLMGARWLGIELNKEANAAGGPCLSQSDVSAWVVPTDEELMIARHAIHVTRIHAG